jgi:hypothetical protein
VAVAKSIKRENLAHKIGVFGGGSFGKIKLLDM